MLLQDHDDRINFVPPVRVNLYCIHNGDSTFKIVLLNVWYVLVYLTRTTLNHNGCMPYHIIMFAIQKNSRIFHNAPMKFSHVNYDYKVLKKPVIIFLKKSFREYYVFVSKQPPPRHNFLSA